MAPHLRKGTRLERSARSGALLAIVLAGASATASAQRAPAPSPAVASAATDSVAPGGARRAFAIFGEAAANRRDSLVSLARAQLGRRYVYGGETPDRGFDCSGLIRYILAKLDVPMPRTAAQQASVGESLPRDTASLEPGDLVTFGKGTRASHIGIYIGDGRFIHASSAAGRVIESKLVRPPARRIKPWRGARRLVLGDSAAVAGEDHTSG